MNKIGLPLFYYPSKLVYVDDNRNLLDAMSLVLSKNNPIETFQSAVDCLHYIENHNQPSARYSFLKSVMDDENYGVLNHTPIDFDVTELVKLINNENRYNEISVVIIDYNMPEMDGITLAEKIRDFPAKKLLLTGMAESNQVVNAFNEGLIQNYVRKFEDCMEDKLIVYLQKLTSEYFELLTAPLLSCLEIDNKLPQSDPIFIGFFKQFCIENDIIEYYLIDKQGSLLLVDKKNNSSYLVIQSEKNFNSWISFYVSENKIPHNILDSIKLKRWLPFLGIGKDLWQSHDIDWEKHLYPANILEGRERYFWFIVK
jgi:CheY-like chemotaxis protein